MAFHYHKQETEYTCGAAAMRMVLESIGINRSEKEIAKLLKTNKIRGTWHKNFPIVAEKYKLNCIVRRNARISDLKKLQKENYSIILCYYCPAEKVDHYSLLRKIDSRFIYFWDPWFGPNHKYSLNHFNKIWKSDPKYEKEKKWLIAMKRPASFLPSKP